MPGSSRSAASGRDGSIGCHSRHARLLVPQQPQRLPAGPGLARGGPADQHRDPAAALRRRPHHPGQLRIVAARHVHRQLRQPRIRVFGLDRPVHLQRERVGHLTQRPPPDLLTPAPAASAPPRAGQLAQRAFHQLPERVRAREGLRGQVAVLDPAAERVLAVPELAVDQRRRRDPHVLSAGVQQEHQPGQARLSGGIELQLRIGHLRLSRTGEPYRVPSTPMYTSHPRTRSAHTCAGA